MFDLEYCYRETNITPQESVLLAGYANRSGTSNEIHRPLSSRCLVLKRGKIQVCIIVNDLMEVPPEIVHDIREKINQNTDINYDAIIVVTIHTHSAPLMEYGIHQKNDNYINMAVARIIDNATEALLNRNLIKARILKIGSNYCEIGANRRLIIPEEGPAYRISDPEGIRDTEVTILQISDEHANNMVTLFNYACHPVTLGFNNLAVSTDYPGKAREVIEKTYGGKAIFLNGAAANINPVEAEQTNTTITDKVGTELGNTVINAELKPIESDLDLKHFSGKVKIPYRDQNITREFIIQEIQRKSLQSTEFYHWQDDLRSWADKILNLLEQDKVQKDFQFQISAIRLGPALLYFTQGELFVEYQLELKKRFSGYRFFCIGYAHGEGAYIPTAKDYKQQGYETDQAYIYQGLPSPFTQEIEKIYLKDSISIIDHVLD